MHIMEGYLPPEHALAWTAISVPFVVHGGIKLARMRREQPGSLFLLGAAGAFTFVLSALKLPSVTGSCSHPTGTGLGAILFGPSVMAIIGTIVLLFQALLLAHGGITTLGANAFSMAIVGPIVAYAVYRVVIRLGFNWTIAVFLAAMLGNFSTYAVTSVQLALAFPDPSGGFVASLVKFFSIFGLTQIPLAVVEGLLTVAILNVLRTSAVADLARLGPVAKDLAR